MFTQFETDKSLEESGVWLDYGEYRVLVAHAGGANKKYLSYAEAKTKPFRRLIQNGQMEVKKSEELLHDIFATAIVKDWEIAETKKDGGIIENKDGRTKWKKGIHKKGGGTLEPTKANVMLTFKLLPKLFFDIQQAAEGIALFRVEDMEDDSKNL